MSINNLDSAYRKFFKEKKGFPKFKSKHGKQSCQFPQHGKVDFDNNKLSVVKFREGIKTKFDRTFDGKIKTVTISKMPTGKYFASILVEEECDDIVFSDFNVNNAIGIDLGIKYFAITSEGEKFSNPKHLSKSERKLIKAQKLLSRKKKGSKNRNRQRIKVALIHEKITNQRNDFLHKVSRYLVSENQATTYCLETLNIKGMVKNHKLAKSISDVGWGTFVKYLEYKANWEGKNILKIGTFIPSSKTCNNCGTINDKLALKDREWTCDCCKTVLDRDINAAKNIKMFAFADIKPK